MSYPKTLTKAGAPDRVANTPVDEVQLQSEGYAVAAEPEPEAAKPKPSYGTPPQVTE